HIRENESNSDETSLLVQYRYRFGEEKIFLSILENLNGRIICFQTDGTHFTSCAFKEFAYLLIFHRLNCCFCLKGKKELSRFVGKLDVAIEIADDHSIRKRIQR